MKIKKLIKIALSFLAIWYFAHVTFIIFDGLSDDGKSADIAVILGNKVNEDGQLSERLEKRMERGLQLYQNKRVHKIVVSGGFGKEGFFEGEKMKEYLLKNKVPENNIVVDNHGDNTEATVKNTLRLKDSLGFKSVIVVSQYFHVTRTKKFFKENGFENVSSVSPDYFEIRDLYSISREFVAYYYQ